MLVNQSHAVDHEAINRDDLSGMDDDSVPKVEAGNTNLDLFAILDAPGTAG